MEDCKAYEVLANIYDYLVKDDNVTNIYTDFIKSNISNKDILEVACGSGELGISLANSNYNMDCSDLSGSMIKKALEKKAPNNINFFVMDMLKIDIDKQYDGIICFCDSINYLSDIVEVEIFFKQAYDHLKTKGKLIFDMHSEQRLLEFEEEFIEDGKFDNYYYQWTISSVDDKIYQYFNILFDNHNYLEQHVQTVFPLDKVTNILEKIGFKVDIYDDQDVLKEDLQERYFIVGEKT
ncbi:MAG: class I SAM-dependent methyltransferase [Erysipelotrichaceae bacterium]